MLNGCHTQRHRETRAQNVEQYESARYFSACTLIADSLQIQRFAPERAPSRIRRLRWIVFAAVGVSGGDRHREPGRSVSGGSASVAERDGRPSHQRVGVGDGHLAMIALRLQPTRIVHHRHERSARREPVEPDPPGSTASRLEDRGCLETEALKV